MKNSNDQGSGLAVSAGFAAVFVILFALLIFQPKAAIWISDAVEAEFLQMPNQVQPVRLAEPRRRPIDPGEWVKPLTKQAAK